MPRLDPPPKPTAECPEIEAARLLVMGTCSYVDSIEVQSNLPFRSDFLRSVLPECNPWGPISKPTYGNRRIHSLHLHQPSKRAVEMVAMTSYRVTRVAVALDLLTATGRNASHLHHVLDRHLIKGARGPGGATRTRMSWYEGRGGPTTYFDKSVSNRRGTNLVIYSDMLSKVLKAPCCHVEARLSGFRELERAGLDNARSILSLDHRAFWETRLDLRDFPSWEAIYEGWLRAVLVGGRCAWTPLARKDASWRIANVLMRIAMSGCDTELRCADLRTAWAEFKVPLLKSIRFPKIETGWMLPEPSNALWGGRADAPPAFTLRRNKAN